MKVYFSNNKIHNRVLKTFTGQIKRLHNLYESCFVSRDGLIVPNKLSSNVSYGRHWCYCEEMELFELIPPNMVLDIDVTKIYEIVKTKNGKLISSMYIKDLKLFIEYKEDREASTLVEMVGSLISTPYVMETYNRITTDSNIRVEITSDMIAECIDRTSSVIIAGAPLEFSKYLIPYISVKESKVYFTKLQGNDTVTALFGLDEPINEETILPITIVHDRLDIVSYHAYLILS